MFPVSLGMLLITWSAGSGSSAVTPAEFWRGTLTAAIIWAVAELLHAATAATAAQAATATDHVNCTSPPEWGWEAWKNS